MGGDKRKEKGKSTGNNKKETLNVVAMVWCSKEVWCNDHCMFVYSFTDCLVKSVCLVNHIYIGITSLSLLHTELWILSNMRQLYIYIYINLQFITDVTHVTIQSISIKWQSRVHPVPKANKAE